MWQRLHAWLHATQLRDPIEQQQAPMLQLFFLSQIVAIVVCLPVGMILNSDAVARVAQVISFGLVGFGACIATVMLRRGHFTTAVLTSTIGNTLILGGLYMATGIRTQGGLVMMLVVPIVLAGLLLGRRSLFALIAISSAVFVAVLLAEVYRAPWIGIVQMNPLPTLLISFAITMSMLGLFFDRFGLSLRQALAATSSREQELERLRASLEHTVAERTSALATALRGVEQREAVLARTHSELQTSNTALQGMSAPVLPVLPGVLVAPLIGAIDQARAAHFTTNVLEAVERGDNRHVIMDVTGVPEIDTSVAQAVLQTAAAVRLLGSQVVLVGVRPEVAQTLVTLGIDLKALSPYLDLQDAVTALLPNAPATKRDMRVQTRG